MLLPGPEALQLATYSGWLLNGFVGGLTAGLLFILPSVFILMGLCIVYLLYGNTPLIAGLFIGMKPAVVAIVILAVYKIGYRALKRKIDVALAAGSLVALLVFNVPYLVVMLSAIVIGVAYSRLTKGNSIYSTGEQIDTGTESTYLINRIDGRAAKRINWQGFAAKTILFLLFWGLPFAVFYLATANYKFWKDLSLFFTQAALFTFGGAYSVLSYVAQYTVEKLHWLTRSEMIDGLALGETTPGPLMMVLPYVGFVSTAHHFGGSVIAGCIGLLVSTYFTFFPSFFFILLGAPVVERTQDNQAVKLALSFVTAAVVGVIANLAVFMARAVIYPEAASLWQPNYIAMAWVIISLIALKKININMIVWIGISALFGLCWKLFLT
jgi:chromate transporter